MKTFTASLLVFLMTFNASADEVELIMEALRNPILTEAEMYPQPQIPDPKLLQAGDAAPYDGLLLDQDLFRFFGERIPKINACEAALSDQVGMMIEVQNQKIELEFERDQYRYKSIEENVMFFILGALVMGAVTQSQH